MKRLMSASAAVLLSLSSASSLALADIISFLNFDREAVKSVGGQTFPWSSGGLSGTVTIRPSGPIAARQQQEASAAHRAES